MLPTTASLVSTEAAAAAPQAPIDVLPATSGLSKGLRWCITLPACFFVPVLLALTLLAAVDPSGQNLQNIDYCITILYHFYNSYISSIFSF